MKVLLLATGADTGGQGYRLKVTIERHLPGWTAHSMAASKTYLAFPADVPFRPALAEKLYDAADVVHLRNQLDGWRALDGGQGKPTIVHHHGTQYRAGHARLHAEAVAAGVVEVASTLDLTLLEDGLRWLPAPHDLEAYVAIRERELARRPADPDRVRVVHAPTNRTVKSTREVLAAVQSLRDRRLPVDLVLVEHRTWRDCLALKAAGDVYVDQVKLGYGNNAVEAWAMGMPVVAGADDPRVLKLMRSTFGQLPFVLATEGTIEARLEALVRSRAMRDEWAGRGLEHARRFHAEATVAPILAELYQSAGPTRGAPPRAQRPLTTRELRRASGRQLYVTRGIVGTRGDARVGV